MTKAIWLISYKLKKDSSEQGFLAASKKCHNEVLSKKPGFVSWQVLRQEDGTYADLVTWESLAHAEAAESDQTPPTETAQAFYAHINLPTCKSRLYEIIESH
ncbi:antibiotic biosynthesis monooxygenase [Candidatus Saccharibacteria bacterium]|nr:antibiotic biosynthesis monooxygenase [Candidatus Saccharibacteria bacterium]